MRATGGCRVRGVQGGEGRRGERRPRLAGQGPGPRPKRVACPKLRALRFVRDACPGRPRADATARIGACLSPASPPVAPSRRKPGPCEARGRRTRRAGSISVTRRSPRRSERRGPSTEAHSRSARRGRGGPVRRACAGAALPRTTPRAPSGRSFRAVRIAAQSRAPRTSRNCELHLRRTSNCREV